ncbi:hypothetical protein ABK040_002197 [Willaertia magna]
MSTSTTNPQTASCLNIDEIERKINKWKSNLEELYCPISHQIMKDPVILETGHTFERHSIEEWLLNNNTCPITRKQLEYLELVPNMMIKLNVDKEINQFVNNVLKYITIDKCSNSNVTDICKEIVDEAIDLINIVDNRYKDLIHLQTIILLKQFSNKNEKSIVEKCLNNITIENLFNNEEKLVYLFFLTEINHNNYFLDEINTLKLKLFKKHVKSKPNQNNLIDKIIKSVSDDEKIGYLYILLSNNAYDIYKLFKKFLNLKINYYSDYFIKFFKLFSLNHINNIKLTTNEMERTLNKIKNCKDLKTEIKSLSITLYNKEFKLEHLELAYKMDEDSEMIRSYLMKRYLDLKMLDKYSNLFIKHNKNLDSNTINLIKLLNNQNNQNKQTENNQLILRAKRIINKTYKFFDVIEVEVDNSDSVQKDDGFFSNVFEACGIDWALHFYPKGTSISNNNESALFLYLYDEHIEYVDIDFYLGNEYADEAIKNSYKNVKIKILHGHGNNRFDRNLFNSYKTYNSTNYYRFLVGINVLNIKYVQK